jgi:predicted transcriptional regulator
METLSVVRCLFRTTFDFAFFMHAIEKQLTEIHERISKLERKVMDTQAQLDAVIAALPGQIETAVETAVEAAVQPIITALQNAQGAQDFTTEVDALTAMPAAVASAVATAVTPAALASGTGTPA